MKNTFLPEKTIKEMMAGRNAIRPEIAEMEIDIHEAHLTKRIGKKVSCRLMVPKDGWEDSKNWKVHVTVPLSNGENFEMTDEYSYDHFPSDELIATIMLLP